MRTYYVETADSGLFRVRIRDRREGEVDPPELHPTLAEAVEWIRRREREEGGQAPHGE